MAQIEKKHILSYEYYKRDINRYRNKFEATIQKVCQIILEETDIQKAEARIKSYKSFMTNLYKEKGGIKNVNDCFGIKVMILDESAIERIIKRLEGEGHLVRSIKDHKNNANTNYNGIHVVLEFENSTIPFEIQFRTPERSKGKLPHDIYKTFGTHKKDINEQKKIILNDFIRLVRLKINGDYGKFIQELPISYAIDINNNKIKIKRQSEKEILRNLYPTVEEVLGKEVFNRLLNKLFPRAVRKNNNGTSEYDRKILNMFLDFTVEMAERRFKSGQVSLRKQRRKQLE